MGTVINRFDEQSENLDIVFLLNIFIILVTLLGAGAAVVAVWVVAEASIYSRNFTAIVAGCSNWQWWTAGPGARFMSDRCGQSESSCRCNDRDS